MNDKNRWVWDAFWAILILLGVVQAVAIWKDALREPDILRQEEGEHAWNIKGRTMRAHHATSTVPDYNGYTVTGWDENNNAIWMISGVKEHKQLK